MRKHFLLLCLLSALLPLSASPFVTDLMPDYFFNIDPLIKQDSGWYIYSALDYTHLLENTDSHFDDFQINSGVLYIDESFAIDAGWNGSILTGVMTIDGYDEVIEDGDRDITSGRFYNGFQFDFYSENLSFSIYSLGEEFFYRMNMQSPEFYGFYLSFEAERAGLTVFEADLVKNYSFNGILSDYRFLPGLGWKNRSLNVELNYIHSQINFSESVISDNPLVFDLNSDSTYGVKAGLALDLSPFLFGAVFRQIEYDFFLTGHTDSTQVLYIESENNDDGHINLIFREFESTVSLFKGKLQVGSFYQSFHIPNETVNRGFVDMDPLSPVGTIYRRKDIVEDFGLYYQQVGGKVGTEWSFPHVEFSCFLNLSYLSIHMIGTYYYMDGFVSFFPFPHWTNVTVYDEEDITDTFEYFIIEPEFFIGINLGRFYLQVSLSQIIPIPLDTDLIHSFASIQELSTSGGFRGSLQASFRF